jgi:hypothetical protein
MLKEMHTAGSVGAPFGFCGPFADIPAKFHYER